MAGPGEAPDSPLDRIETGNTERHEVSQADIDKVQEGVQEAARLAEEGGGNPQEAAADLDNSFAMLEPDTSSDRQEDMPTGFNEVIGKQKGNPTSDIKIETKDGNVTEATINGEPANPEEIKNMFGKIAKMFGLEKWFTKFFEAFGGIDQKDTQAMKDALGKITDRIEFKETLAKYNPKVGETGKGETTLQFAEPAKVIGEKTAKKADGAEKDPKPESVKIEDGKIVLADGAKISQVTEKDGKLYLAIDNKDGSHDVYVVEGAKPAENPASATA